MKKLAWNETKLAGGAKVVFEGPSAAPTRAWVGVSAIFTAALFVYFIYFPAHPKPVTKEAFFRLMPAVLAIAGLSLVVGQFPGVSAGTLEVDRTQIKIVPAASWRLETMVFIANIDYVTAETEDEEAVGKGRFRVRVTLRDGSKKTLAMFGDADSALFMSQRLEALVDRARSFRG